MDGKRPPSWTWTNYSWLVLFISIVILVVGGLISDRGRPDDGPPAFFYLFLMSMAAYVICSLMAAAWGIVDFSHQRPKYALYALCPAAVIIVLALPVYLPPVLTWMRS